MRLPLSALLLAGLCFAQAPSVSREQAVANRFNTLYRTPAQKIGRAHV